MSRPSAPTRENSGVLSALEQRALHWLAPRVPRRIGPDHLTALGFGGAVVALFGYWLASRHPLALWLVNVGLVINWLGDSLDGSIARLRGAERPRYGFFLDQSIDVISQALFALGLAISGYILPEIVAAGFAAYLMMTVQSLLRAQTSGIFALATGGMGLTEVRCLFIVANIAFFVIPPRPLAIASVTLTYADACGIVWIVVNLALYLSVMVRESKTLAAQESVDRDGDRSK